MHSVDIDSETILLDGAWRTREELVLDIRTMLDAGNYGIARHSAALEALAEAMSDVRRIEFKATSSLTDDLHAAAAKEGRTPDALLRDAVARYLATLLEDPSLRPPAEPEGRRPTYPELAAVHPADIASGWTSAVPGAASSATQPSVLVDAALKAVAAAAAVDAPSSPSEVSAEPATREEAARAVDLKPKGRVGAGDSEARLERRWFDGAAQS